jgi:steroid delta-isomerase-like uncharacterized protein
MKALISIFILAMVLGVGYVINRFIAKPSKGDHKMDNKEQTITSMDNTTNLERVIQAFNEHNLAVLEESVTPGFTRHDLSGAFLNKGTGSTEVSNFIHLLLEAFPDIQLEVQDMISSDDKITMRYTFSGTHLGSLFGTAPTGRQVVFNGINIYRFEGEKIAEVWQLWDWTTVLQQIGILNL